MVNSYYLNALCSRYKITPFVASLALGRREGIFEFACEYIERDDLDLPFNEKYPAFYAFTIQRRDYEFYINGRH